MASKISLILSLMFVITFFVLSSDVVNIQYLYSNLDAASVNVNYLITKESGVGPRTLDYIAKQKNMEILYSNEEIRIGDPYEYTLTSVYSPFVMNEGKVFEVSIVRSVVIGYLN